VTFETKDHRHHVYGDGLYDGLQVSEELHGPIVGECVEMWVVANGELRYTLSAVVTSVRF
jgi:hypothetical protein